MNKNKARKFVIVAGLLLTGVVFGSVGNSADEFQKSYEAGKNDSVKQEIIETNPPTSAPVNSEPTNKVLNIDNIKVSSEDEEPTATPTPVSTHKPTPAPTIIPTPAPTQAAVPGSNYICNCSKTCTQINSCTEAYYQLNTCGCRKRDGDKDGVPCKNLCR